MKSIRLRIAARLVMWLGLVSCVLGAGAYCVICMPEVLNLPFDWRYLVAVGACLIIFILVSAILHVFANHAQNSLEAYCEKEEVEDVMAEMSVEPKEELEEEEKEELAVDFASEEEPEKEPEAKEAPKKKFAFPKEKLKLIKAIAIVGVPVVVSCVTAISVAKSKKKKKIEKDRREKEANRQAFYRWLG